MQRIWAPAIACLLATFASTTAAAQEPAGAGVGVVEPPTRPETATPRIALRWDPVVDYTVTGVLAASLVSWGFLKTKVGIDDCVICDPKGETNAIDGFFRDSFRRDDGATAATLSHILSYGGGPAMGVALTIGVAAYDRRINEAPLNALLVVEASLTAVVVKEAFTALLRRERPAVHVLDGDEKTKALAEGDPLESFPGGHTASIMAITASAATIATLRGYRLAPLIWIIGSTLGVTSTYLRIASDQHYFTDNVAGAVIGIGVGAGIPLLFHSRVRDGSRSASWLSGAMVTSRAVPGGRVIGLGWAF